MKILEFYSQPYHIYLSLNSISLKYSKIIFIIKEIPISLLKPYFYKIETYFILEKLELSPAFTGLKEQMNYLFFKD
jgi:hypothetical protein